MLPFRKLIYSIISCGKKEYPEKEKAAERLQEKEKAAERFGGSVLYAADPGSPGKGDAEDEAEGHLRWIEGERGEIKCLQKRKSCCIIIFAFGGLAQQARAHASHA